MIRDPEEFIQKCTMFRRWQAKYKECCEKITEIEKSYCAFPDPIEQKQYYELARDDYKEKCQEVEQAFKKLPEDLRSLVKDIYINKKTSIEDAANKMGYSRSGLTNYLYRTLDKVFI